MFGNGVENVEGDGKKIIKTSPVSQGASGMASASGEIRRKMAAAVRLLPSIRRQMAFLTRPPPVPFLPSMYGPPSWKKTKVVLFGQNGSGVMLRMRVCLDASPPCPHYMSNSSPRSLILSSLSSYLHFAHTHTPPLPSVSAGQSQIYNNCQSQG